MKAPQADGKVVQAEPVMVVVEKPKEEVEAAVHDHFEGVATQAKMGPMVLLDDGNTIWVDLGDHGEWPNEVLGKRVVVEGVFKTRADLPVFESKAGDLPRAGIPVPPGTDLQAASRRQVLVQVTWKQVEE
jgi:hypothetical protein